MTGSAQTLPEALADPGFYPDRPERVEVRETHISWVFLAGERAYKLKKPLVLPFLDYGTPARRRRMCREEVRLNRRLAPGIYLGVRAVAATPDGFELAEEGDRRAVDHVVEMRRYDEHATMAAALARGELREADVAAVARALAAFHARARPAPEDASPVRAVERRIDRNLEELLELVELRGSRRRLLALERFCHAFVAARADTLEARARGGHVREGHGDLRAEHVLLGDPPQVVDCVEFDPALRTLDVADDLAFLVMELEARHGERFAKALVGSYRAAGGDPGDDALLAFYAVHRALVRAKVAVLRTAQHAPESAAHGGESAQARDLLALAERFAWRARLPLVIVVCGVPASGKTHLSERLAAASGLPHLSTDVTRKGLAGVGPGQRAAPAHYGESFNRATYGSLGRRAAIEAAEHGGAIVDGTFRHRADRNAFAEAFAGAARVVYVECRAPGAILERRALRRDREAVRVSDATHAVVLRERTSWEPLDEAPPEAHLVLRTDRPAEDILADLAALLDRRLGAGPAATR